MTIREGATPLKPAQDKIIRDYLDGVRMLIDSVLQEQERISVSLLLKLLAKDKNKNLSLKRGLTLTPKYKFDELDTEGGVFDEKIIDKKFEIIVNMFHCVLGFDETNGTISGIDWSEFYSTFIHEYKHFVQYLLSNPNVDPFSASDDTTYFDRPHEQQAWAEGYLEKLKHQLQTTDYDVILNFLKKNELSNSPTLRRLKQTNFHAWKQIMKQVVLAAIRDANQK